MAELGNIGSKITGVIGDFLLLVIVLALATQLSPTAVDYIKELGTQMTTNSTGLLNVLGGLVKDYGPVIWYAGLAGGAFGAIYDMIRKFFS